MTAVQNQTLVFFVDLQGGAKFGLFDGSVGAAVKALMRPFMKVTPVRPKMSSVARGQVIRGPNGQPVFEVEGSATWINTGAVALARIGAGAVSSLSEGGQVPSADEVNGAELTGGDGDE